MPFCAPIRYSGSGYNSWLKFRPAIGSIIFSGLKLNDVVNGYSDTFAEFVSC